MAIKVNYNSTQGLVQELDPTGAGGFLVNGTDIGQKVLTKLEVDAELPGNAKVPLDVDKDVILVTTKAGVGVTGEHITLKKGSYFGQMIIIVYAAETHNQNTLQVFAEHNLGGVASPAYTGIGMNSPVNVIDGNQNERSSARCMWIDTQWIPLGR